MSDMMKALLEGIERGVDGKDKILPEAAIARLSEVLDRINAPVPFRPGDVVTIREDAPVRGAGKPHIVVEVVSDAPLFLGTPGDWPEAARRNVVVISLRGDSIATHMVAHWMLQPFELEGVA